jgi:hypothetical protein
MASRRRTAIGDDAPVATHDRLDVMNQCAWCFEALPSPAPNRPYHFECFRLHLAAVRAELAAMRIASHAIRAEAADHLRALRSRRGQQTFEPQ